MVGRRAGASQGVYSCSDLRGLGERESGKKETRSADLPRFGRAKTLERLERLRPKAGASMGWGGGQGAPLTLGVLKELRRDTCFAVSRPFGEDGVRGMEAGG